MLIPRSAPTAALLASGTAVFLGCMTVVQGMTPPPLPGGEPIPRASITAGGGQGQGTLQIDLGGAFPVAEWCTLEAGLVTNGVYAAFNHPLRDRQGLTMNWGVWPYGAITFYMGPVDFRAILFGIGGGGPEGPGGYMGLAGGTLGLRIDPVRSIHAGFTAQAVFGCCEGEYEMVSYQVPVDFVFWGFRFGPESDWGLRFALESIYSFESVDTHSGDPTIARDSVQVLLAALLDAVD